MLEESYLIEGTGYEAREYQRSKQRCQFLHVCWKVQHHAQSLFCIHTLPMNYLIFNNQNVFYRLVPQPVGDDY